MSAELPFEVLARGDKAAREKFDLPVWFSVTQSLIHYMLGNLREAIRISRETIVLMSDFYPQPILMAAFAPDPGLTDKAAGGAGSGTSPVSRRAMSSMAITSRSRPITEEKA